MYIAAFEQLDTPAAGRAVHPSSELPCGEDSSATPRSELSPSSKEKLIEHYRTIGQALLVCEASSLRVGIPWIAPVGEVVKRRYEVGTRPENYIRETLVTVSTNCLQIYVEDLEKPQEEAPGDSELNIELRSWIERYSFSTACAAASMFVGIAAAVYLFPSALAGLILGMVMLVLGYLLGQSYSTSASRRLSFRRLLMNEIMRRRGINPLGGPSGTRVYPGATPLSE